MNKKIYLAALFALIPLAFPLLGFAQDTDGDLMLDDYELLYPCLNVNLPDGDVDYDSDSLTSLEEYQYSPLLDPCAADTDADALPDGWEYQYLSCGFDPLSWQSERSYAKLGADLRVTNVIGESRNPSLTWTGSEYGLSWDDKRDADSEIYFARVSASGAKLGADERITSSGGNSLDSALSWTGSEFGVCWEDYRDGNYEIYFARVSAAGQKLGADLRVTGNVSSSMYPAMAFSGSEFGVSWQDKRDGDTEIYFARLSADGLKLDSDLRVSDAPGYSVYPSLAWTGSEFGVSWQDDRDGDYEIYFARLSATGLKLGADLRVTSVAGESRHPSLAWTGSEFGVSWDDWRTGPGFNYKIFFARISAVGQKLGADVPITCAGDISEYPSLVWTGSEFGVSWQDDCAGVRIYLARISPAGAQLDAELMVTTDYSGAKLPSLVWTGSDFGVSWHHFPEDNFEISFARISNQPGTYTDKDGDGLGDDQEYAHGANPCRQDTDSDGLQDLTEIGLGTDPNDPDSDHDGVDDGAERNTYHTNPLAWDTDGDALPDAFEIAHAGSSPALDPRSPADGDTSAPFDSDDNSNVNEYWNGADLWATNPTGGPGCFYWGDAGAGDGIVGPADAIELQKAIIGIPANYSGVIPPTGETQELSMDGSVGPSDFIIIQQLILSIALPSLPSRPTALDVIESPGAPVLVGNTCHVTVAVRNEAGHYTPGIGVVFAIVSGPGTATLFGGEGAANPNQRYDISGSVAGPSGRSRIVLRVDGAGAITVQARIPVCGAMPNGRSCPEIVSDPVVITGQ